MNDAINKYSELFGNDTDITDIFDDHAEQVKDIDAEEEECYIRLYAVNDQLLQYEPDYDTDIKKKLEESVFQLKNKEVYQEERYLQYIRWFIERIFGFSGKVDWITVVYGSADHKQTVTVPKETAEYVVKNNAFTTVWEVREATDKEIEHYIAKYDEADPDNPENEDWKE